MHTLYIVQTGQTFPAIAAQHGDFVDWIAAGLAPAELPPTQRPALQVLQAQSSGSYPDLALCAGIVISGSHAMVTDTAPWLHDLEAWLYRACMAGVPVLGICFGHQLLAKILGGHVSNHPAGLELGTVPIAVQADVSQDPLWQHMPSCFDAQVVHYQSVRRLPKDACVLAGNSHEPHQAFRWRQHVWGVQFHPEFSQAAMQAYIAHLAADLEQNGICSPSMRQLPCRATPEAAQLLARFSQYTQRLAQAHPAPWRHAA